MSDGSPTGPCSPPPPGLVARQDTNRTALSPPPSWGRCLQQWHEREGNRDTVIFIEEENHYSSYSNYILLQAEKLQDPVPSSYDIPLRAEASHGTTHTERACQGWKAQPLLQHPAYSLTHWGEPGHRGSGLASTHCHRGGITTRIQSYPGAAAEPSNKPGRNNSPHHYAGKRCNCKRHQG